MSGNGGRSAPLELSFMTPHPDPEIARIERRVIQAAESLLIHDHYLLVCDLNERSITHKFAEHLQRQFPKWNVDCEYNRDGHDPKRLDLPPKDDISSDDLNAKTIFPDIIIHRRGTKENLVVVEVKKSTNHESDDWDIRKLRAFRSQLGYKVALFFRFQTGAANLNFQCERG
jgi:hypothetical protein